MLKPRPRSSRNRLTARFLLAASVAAACLPALARENFEVREARETRETREARDTRQSRETRETREVSDKGKAEREQRDAGRGSSDAEKRSGGDSRESGGASSGSGGSSTSSTTSAKSDGGGDSGKTGNTTTTGSKSGDGGSATDAAKARADAEKDQAKRTEDATKAEAEAAEDAAKEAEDAAKDAADAAEDDAKDAEHDDDRIDMALDDRIRSGEPLSVEHGIDGRERISGEVLMIDRSAAVARVRSAGYSLRSERTLPATGEIMARVQLRAGQSVEQALRALQMLAPQGTFAPNHAFRPSQDNPGRNAARPVAPAIVLPAGGTGSAARPFSVGIIDTGADLAAAPIAAAVSRSRSFVGNAYLPRGHGTLVAEIAAAGGARLALADVFGADADQRLVAPADAIASAIAWLIDERAAVINISIEGPDNPVMGLMVRRALAAGIVIVAAAGNGGPAAPPAYPAAYPGVIAVTAIDGQDHVYRRANRGAYITFAAPGVNVVSSTGSFGGQPVSGTSFAAPAVTATIARDLLVTGRSEAVVGSANSDVSTVLSRLRAAARDLGPAGFDPVYGWGALPTAATSR